MKRRKFISETLTMVLGGIIASCTTQAFSQQPPPNIWDGELLHSATPRVKTTRDYWLNGKVRLVVEKQDSTYFDEQGRIVRARRKNSRDIKIATYEYDEQGHLTRQNSEVYGFHEDGSRFFRPDETHQSHWEYNGKGYLWRRIYMTTGVEKEQFEHTTYTTLKDTVVVRCEVDDQIQDVHTGWGYQYDLKKGVRNKYEWDYRVKSKKNLVETVNFDSIGNITRITSFIGGQPVVKFQRQDVPGGCISSLFHFDDSMNVKFEEKTTWKGSVKQLVKYYSIDSNKVRQLLRTEVCNEAGETTADSLHEYGIVQQYYFKSGNPDLLQINTDEKGNIVLQLEVKYNPKGYMIYQKSERGGDVTETKYDDQRNMIYYKDSSSMQEHKFIYDRKGNWIKATHSGTLFDTYSTTRSVYYYL